MSFGGALEDFGVNVGAVLNEGHLQISPEHLAPQQIPIDVAAGVAQVAQVAKVIDREPAAVDARLAGGQRGKKSARRVRALMRVSSTQVQGT